MITCVIYHNKSRFSQTWYQLFSEPFFKNFLVHVIMIVSRFAVSFKNCRGFSSKTVFISSVNHNVSPVFPISVFTEPSCQVFLHMVLLLNTHVSSRKRGSYKCFSLCWWYSHKNVVLFNLTEGRSRAAVSGGARRAPHAGAAKGGRQIGTQSSTFQNSQNNIKKCTTRKKGLLRLWEKAKKEILFG